MDALPPELLKMIVDEVQRDPRIFRGQRTLAALARTNRTFYSICHPRLYRSPVLGNPKMMMKWSRFYVSRVDPWVVCKGSKSLENVIVPKKITFKLLKDRKTSKSDTPQPIFRRLEAPIDETALPLSAFSGFFFRNLTTFSVSKDSPFSADFVATLFGPDGSSRTSITKLLIQPVGFVHLFEFLFGAFERMEWEFFQMTLQDLTDEIPDGDPEEQFRDSLREYLREGYGLAELGDEDYDKLKPIAQRLASKNYRVAWHLYPINCSSEGLLPRIQETRMSFNYPFNSLQNLTMSIEDNYILYLIFYSYLFPSLRRVKLIGELFASHNMAHDVKLLRYSITARKGKILPPRLQEEIDDLFPNVCDTWEPLTREEREQEPVLVYFGPRLSKLDLSHCLLSLEEE